MKAGMSELRSSRRVRANGGVRPAREYDPFVRGRFPVGVRTIQALDKVRDRLFPCEIWYPAAAQHAGHDIASGTQDFFTVPPGDTPRSQMAVRNAAARPGTYPPIVFSHHRRTYSCVDSRFATWMPY